MKEGEMLGDHSVSPNIAVKNLDVAKKFYEDILGLTLKNTFASVMTFKSGDSELILYESQFAGTNKATYAHWGVGEALDSIVSDLKSKGVTFEKYDMPDVTHEGEIHVMGDYRAVWFKDPDGNILCVDQM